MGCRKGLATDESNELPVLPAMMTGTEQLVQKLGSTDKDLEVDGDK